TINTHNLQIDANSGFPSRSTDLSGLDTSYSYDPQGRLTTVKPPAQAWTEYAYAPTDNPPSVAIRQWPKGTSTPSGNPLTDRRLYFDGLGRLMQARTRMPDGWSVISTTYDRTGRVRTTSMPQYHGNSAYENFTPDHVQTTDYEPFGRVAKITAPDTKSTKMTYTAH